MHFIRELYSSDAALTQLMTSTGPQSSEITPPVLKQENGPVQDILICSICCEIPLDIVVTRCNHVFCRGCIVRALESRQECPIDRYPLSVRNLFPICGVLKQIWERVPVSCQLCEWSGVVGNYTAHYTSQHSVSASSQQDKMLYETETHYERIVARLENENRIIKEKNQELELAFKKAASELERVTEIHDRRMNFGCDYEYNLENVVPLAQDICRALEHEPSAPVRNRVYNGVKVCWEQYKRTAPEERDDVQMLLNICRACYWFTDRQHANFEIWCYEIR